MPTEILTPLRHACTACGGSCQGAYVRLFGDDETDRITRLAGELGVPEPVVDGRLRHDDEGRCVFLGADGLCDVHRRFGMDAKPVVCRQFPLVAVRAEDGGLRVGLDPGCYSARGTWRSGPEVDETRLVANPRPLHPSQLPVEQGFLDATEAEGTTVGRALAVLTGEDPDASGLPPRFAARLLTRLQEAPLAPLVASAAPAMRFGLAPVVSAIPTWSAPPAWHIDADSDAWAVHAVRTTVHLRLVSSTVPVVAGVALLTLSGAVAAGWAGLDGDRFGAAVSAWNRAIRAPAFARALLPEPSTLTWLATGR